MMTKGKWKKIASLALAAILTLSLAAPGFASQGTTTTSGNTNSLTVTSDTSGHTYELYQILGGDVDTIDGDLYLANVIWGDGVEKTDLASAIAKDTTLKDYFTFADTANPQASELADGLANIEAEGSASLTNAFAVAVNANLVDTCIDDNPSEAYDSSTEKWTYTFQGLYDGYYLLRDKPDSLADPEGDDDEDTAGYTLYILQIVNGDNEVEAKTDTTTIDKHIVDPDDGVTLEKTEEYTIGDPITYQLDGSYVPDMTNYSSYWYVVQDTLSAGLTFDNIISVEVGNKTLTEANGYQTGESAYYTYYYTKEDVDVEDVNGNTVTGTKLTIVFNEFYNSYKGTAYDDAEIVIQYNVHLNEDCNIGSVGNDNTVRLIYSNNPNVDYSGEWTEDSDGVGYTTNKKTVTYTTQIKIKKVDDDGNALSDAEFSLSSSDAKYYTYTTTSVTTYKQDATGDYYNKSGVWYTDASDWETADVVPYDSTDPTQTDESRRCVLTSSEVNYYVSASDSSSGSTTVTGTTGADGYVIFTGLGEGTYTLTETDAPEGYNLLTDVITVKIEYKDPTLQTEQPYVDQDKATWNYVVSGSSAASAKSESDGTVLITVENSPASLLPSTGGMGILIYVAVGLCAMTGAVVVLRARNRREEE